MKNSGRPVRDSFDDLGFAKLDLSRFARTGMSETVYAPGKTCEQLLKIFQAFRAAGQAALASRCSPEQAGFVRAGLPDAVYDPVSRLLTLDAASVPKIAGTVAVCTGGTADLPVAGEAAGTAAFFGASVECHCDVGIAGLHRLLSKIEVIRRADVVIAVAGMEGALAGVIAGLVEVPVIAVPTSVGYGASFQGVAPLLTMLNSCAEGVSVVNIDNGFGAGVLACRMLRMAERINRK